ncbi:hypothetical protein EsDP_00004888 [Epichloe bromicola]|uniref:Uncharacterized protein n=1 Tax=Epichloe bromicola TaxID=79588 RepID=A0ABQ0CT15_9HYPO
MFSFVLSNVLFLTDTSNEDKLGRDHPAKSVQSGGSNLLVSDLPNRTCVTSDRRAQAIGGGRHETILSTLKGTERRGGGSAPQRRAESAAQHANDACLEGAPHFDMQSIITVILGKGANTSYREVDSRDGG